MAAAPGSTAGYVDFLGRVPFVIRVSHEDLEPPAHSSVVRRHRAGVPDVDRPHGGSPPRTDDLVEAR